MDLNQQVAIANAVMRIVCGDSRSYYVGRPVEEMNPLIKATFDWGGKQGWSAEQIPQYFGDSFLAYFSGMFRHPVSMCVSLVASCLQKRGCRLHGCCYTVFDRGDWIHS